VKRTLLSVGVALATVGLPVLGAISAAGTAAPVAPAAEPAPALELVTAPRVDVFSYGGRVYDDLGARIAATTEPVELWSNRPSWDDPIRTEWRSSTGTRSLPLGTMKSWSGLPRFARITLRTTAGDVVYDRTRGMCLNGDTQRMRPEAPARSPYPYGCPYSPWTKGSVQGIQEGWSVSLSQGRALRLPLGRYTATVGIAPRYARLFGLTDAQAHRTYTLRVRRGTDDGFFRARERARERARDRARAPLARPAASEPAGTSGGTVAGPTPDLQSLPAFDMSIGPSGHHLRFSATVWNAGDSPLVVDGFRRPGEVVMDAYQYFFDADGNQTGYRQVGEMEWHEANHQHWHFHDFARYRLLAADRTAVVRSKKESFCLANTDAVDYTVPGADWRPENTDLSSACGGRDTLSLREVLSSGSGDTYAQYRAGQSFNLEGLPNGRYYVAVEANPEGNLVESNPNNNVELRRVHLGGTPAHRKVSMADVGVIVDH
jgi:hypothetical protein